MSVSFVVHLHAKDETREQFRAMLYEVLDAMAKEPDFVNTYVGTPLDDPNTFVLYETWACSREEFIANHLSKPYRQAYEKALPAMQAKPRTIEFLEPVRAYPARR